MIDCHKTPYVQPHAFALRGSLVYSLLQEVDKYHSSLVFVPLEDYFRFRLTALVQEQGERVASLQHSRQTGLGFFTSCPIPYRDSKGSTGSSSSSTSGTGSEAQAGLDCDVDPEVVLFLRWSGEAMGAPDFLCGKAVAMNAAARAKVAQLTLALAKTPLSLAAPPLPSYLLPTLPEAATGFIMYEEWGKETAMSWPPAPSGWPGRKALLCVAVLVGGVGGGGVSGGGGGSFGPPLKQASLLDTVQCKNSLCPVLCFLFPVFCVLGPARYLPIFRWSLLPSTLYALWPNRYLCFNVPPLAPTSYLLSPLSSLLSPPPPRTLSPSHPPLFPPQPCSSSRTPTGEPSYYQSPAPIRPLPRPWNPTCVWDCWNWGGQAMGMGTRTDTDTGMTGTGTVERGRRMCCLCAWTRP
ncbi:hypothetical protein B484DRAFT_67955 [Ochromonadaceae sp. CCMP2298]|nr:hypothetical protein B484DRAFT_67955 [Ochromonadaceae sp. CCMP2298]